MQVQSLGWEDPLEQVMATHASILAWRIPRTEELGGLSHRRVRHTHGNINKDKLPSGIGNTCFPLNLGHLEGVDAGYGLPVGVGQTPGPWRMCLSRGASRVRGLGL